MGTGDRCEGRSPIHPTHKTKWGSCSRNAANIRLNTDLAKKPLECLEYLVVYEMLHIIEPTHNSRFIALMDRQMPTGVTTVRC
jgi:predicted metal-dependent hydrolase